MTPAERAEKVAKETFLECLKTKDSNMNKRIQMFAAALLKFSEDENKELKQELEYETNRLAACALSDHYKIKELESKLKKAELKERHLLDVYDFLGLKWGDDPFQAIKVLHDKLKKAEMAGR